MDRRDEKNPSDFDQGNVTNLLTSVTTKSLTRRDFLKIAGMGAFVVVVPQIVCVQVAEGAPPAQGADLTKAKGMVIGDPTRCTGCRRCEIACTSFNDGKVQPALSRIKVTRNLNFGPSGAQTAYYRGEGHFANFLIVQDTCRQCAHPTPCYLACPNNAIEVVAPTNARVVNTSKCTGCRLCQSACPWDMMVFDEQLKKSSKCTLCEGAPECVKACPSAALKYVAWQDRSKDIPQRWSVPAYLSTPPNVASTCSGCHK
ncbi:putative ferredoxin-like protein YdhY [Anaerolineae bacterium]|nr:putative ferredoxin-like protein YdhY [Anaerolineae bacterium]